MRYLYDLVISGGYVVDPINRLNAKFDLGIKDGKIIAVSDSLDCSRTKQVVSANEKLVVPGIIDLHTHLSARHNGACGHNMLVRAGITTTLEIAGPIDSVLPIAKYAGVGLNMAMLNQVHPGVTVKDKDPSAGELTKLIEETLDSGGIGLKLLGGHFPLTPEAIERAIAISYEATSYIAFHAGSTQTGSNLLGALEAIRLAAGRPLHLAHVNSYCRGYVEDCISEAEKIIKALIDNTNIRSESYLSPLNGCSSHIIDGLPESKVTQKCLEKGGYEVSADGMAAAIHDGWGRFNMVAGGENILVSGVAAVAAWRAAKTKGSLAFSVNPLESRLRLASARRADGRFVVDGIATDGGGHVRNIIIECGLPLVKLGAFSLTEFVIKTSSNPAKWLGLHDKGHLGIGADADITIIDSQRCRATTTIIDGKVCMHDNVVCGSNTQVITTARGVKAINKYGLCSKVIDVAATGYFKGM